MRPPPLLQIQHCVSLGPTCNAAEYLRCHPAGLRRYALPFDWIHSDSALVRSCVTDGCVALLDRRSLQSVGAGRIHASGADGPGGGDASAATSARLRRSVAKSRWPARRCLSRNFRTEKQAHIFIHHDPALRDDDFARLHRAADRLRRVLADREGPTLFLHLETNAAPGAAAAAAFVARARQISACLGSHTSTYALAAVRAVPIDAGGEGGGGGGAAAAARASAVAARARAAAPTVAAAAVAVAAVAVAAPCRRQQSSCTKPQALEIPSSSCSRCAA